MIINPYAFSGSYDADAQAWFTAVEAVSSITTPNKVAVNAFVVGCKSDGIWTAIKASCLLCAADDLTGALVPLVGAAPTNNNFVSGDYSRTAGLKGNGSTKWLNSNRNNNADPQNNRHHFVLVSQSATAAGMYLGQGVTGNRSQLRQQSSTNFQVASAFAGSTSIATSSYPNGSFGASRNNSATVDILVAGSASNIAQVSSVPTNANFGVFATSAPGTYSNAGISFYSIGESLNLALLDARLATLMAALT